MTGKTQAWGLALAILAALLILLAIHWPSALIGGGVGWLLGARAPWIVETLKTAWAGIVARLKPAPATDGDKPRALLTLPSKSPNVWQWITGLHDAVKLALVIGAIALVIWLFVSVAGFFRDVGCGVRALTFWPCETKETLRQERDDLRGRLEAESSLNSVHVDLREAADATERGEDERARIRETAVREIERTLEPPSNDPSSPPPSDPVRVYLDALRDFGLRDVPEPAARPIGVSATATSPANRSRAFPSARAFG